MGKVCNVIIESGSSENFVFKKLETTLNVKVEPHPNAYKISLVKKDGVTSQAQDLDQDLKFKSPIFPYIHATLQHHSYLS